MEPEQKSNGALVGAIIVIIILIVGGIYVWQSSITKEKQIESETATVEDSNDLDTLQQDVGATDTSTGVQINGLE